MSVATPTLRQVDIPLQAQYASLTRLAACLVNERLVRALLLPSSTTGVQWCWLSPTAALATEPAPREYLFRLCHLPLTEEGPAPGLRRVSLLHPEDLDRMCVQLGTHKSESGSGSGIDHLPPLPTGLTASEEASPVRLLETTIEWLDPASVDRATAEALGAELASSVRHIAQSYAHRPPTPTLHDGSLVWEQSIVEGHPTHPMHKARCAIAPIPPISLEDDLFHVEIRFITIPRTEMLVRGEFEERVRAILQAAQLPYPEVPASRLLVPIHPLQLPNIHRLFPTATLVAHLALPAHAQASLRTLVPDAAGDHAIKLALGVKITSALRTVTRWTAYQGPGMSPLMDELERRYPPLRILKEVAAVAPIHPDHDVAKHLGCILREEPVLACPGETVILCAGLVERDGAGTPYAVTAFGLHDQPSRLDFLSRYMDLLFRCFLPPLLDLGFAFEAHGQNALLRLHPTSHALLGFAIRDFGGIKAHAPSMAPHIPLPLDLLPGSFTEAKELHEAYTVAYHTLIHCHCQALVRALDLHYSGLGWALVRDALDRHVPRTHPFWAFAMRPTVDLKSFVSMKLDNLYRDYIYSPVPNILLTGMPSDLASTSSSSSSSFTTRPADVKVLS